ncbi:hypothetical protein MYU51_009099 [Penicillium brevicompactum]|uniref:uncharacterized protein n=1 Tax=Penicillium brevicompactum TaxID=5074 RepID=UPI00253F6F90|nr:uncharacterized protein N7506_006558 [Penicillium brevicompactum]KAJ5332775.1 hypothetical protein N7506_006558 [Penicillium brevicompactum]
MADNNAALILAISWTETCIGLILFALRFVSNWKFVGRFRWDFAIAGLTVATETTAQVFLQLSVNAGMGQHISALSDDGIVLALKWSWVFQLLAIAASMLGKLAILAFLVQIRGRHEKKPWLLIVLGVLIGAINIAVLGTILGQCQPMHKLWDDSVEGTCDPGRKINQNYSFFQASFNSFTDAVLATYPVHLFWKLQMKLRIKIALSILMGLGWIAAVCSAVKTYELKALTETTDITWAQSSLVIWASTEAWIVIVVGCVPPIRPLMERVLQRLGLTSKKTSTPYQYRNSSGNAAYGTNKSNPTSHTHFQSNAYRGKTFGGEDDDPGWMELTATEGPNGSKEHIVSGSRDVVITTDIVTRFEDMENHAGPSSGDDSISGEDLIRHNTNDRKGV